MASRSIRLTGCKQSVRESYSNQGIRKVICLHISLSFPPTTFFWSEGKHVHGQAGSSLKFAYARNLTLMEKVELSCQVGRLVPLGSAGCFLCLGLKRTKPGTFFGNRGLSCHSKRFFGWACHKTASFHPLPYWAAWALAFMEWL